MAFLGDFCWPIENWLTGRCAPSAVPLVDDVVATSEMARQNGKELSYPLHRQGQVLTSMAAAAAALWQRS